MENVDSVKLKPGDLLDNRYRIDAEIGTGGYAIVFKARHMGLDRDVAIKVMNASRKTNAVYVERFIREAKIAAKLNHKNSVSIYDYGVVPDSGQPYIVMELLNGRDLYDEIYTIGPIGPKRAFKLFRPVLDALADGHQLGIVHKDLKPENLFIFEPGTAGECMKVLDFGVARIDDSNFSKLTVNGEVTGTPRFLAPEYILSQNVTPAIDVYQMALIISEAITGKPSVLGDPVFAMNCHCKGNIKLANFLLRGRLKAVFLKAVALNPNDRYRNCAEFANALDDVKNEFDREVLINRNVSLITDTIEDDSFAEDEDLSGSSLLNDNSESSGDAGNIKSSEVPTRIVSEDSNRILTWMLFIVILLVLIVPAIVLYHIYSHEDETIEPVYVPAETPAYSFTMASNPTQAVVLDAQQHELCTTPGTVSIPIDELPMTVRFHITGYHDAMVDLKAEDYVETQGKVFVVLKKDVGPQIHWVSDFVYLSFNRIQISEPEEQPASKPKPKATAPKREKDNADKQSGTQFDFRKFDSNTKKLVGQNH